MLSTLQAWAAALERLALRVPELAAIIAPGSWPLATVVALLGVVLLLGGLRLQRLVAPAGGAALGWVIGGMLAPLIPRVPVGMLHWLGAALLGVGSLASPAVYPLAAGALPGALLGAQVAPPGRLWVGAAGGAVVMALLALVLRRLVIAASAALAGSALLSAALLALAPHVRALQNLDLAPHAAGGAGGHAGGGRGRLPARPGPAPEARRRGEATGAARAALGPAGAALAGGSARAAAEAGLTAFTAEPAGLGRALFAPRRVPRPGVGFPATPRAS